MIPLIVKGNPVEIGNPIIGVYMRSTRDINSGYILSSSDCLDVVCRLQLKNTASSDPFVPSVTPVVKNINTLSHIEDGDIICVDPSGLVSTLFRVKSEHNALFITDRCNSNCLMCSQPPKNKDDLDYLYEINRQLIQLLPIDLNVIGITGGEPTILGQRLIELIRQLDDKLPETSVHMLSNGRIFAWRHWAERIAKINKNLVIGIPIYSDNYLDHDYIVQARDAFNQTVIGVHNLARYGQKIEIRVVLHKQSFKRLPQLAKFVFKNLPFVDHVAFMGLEYIGYTPYNQSLLWIEPREYMDELEEAVLFLDHVGMNVSIYNLQHCLLKDTLWKFSRKSISDWKQDYLAECIKCIKNVECGGVFATSKKLSNEIRAITV